jgi:hypothetical protein
MKKQETVFEDAQAIDKTDYARRGRRHAEYQE